MEHFHLSSWCITPGSGEYSPPGSVPRATQRLWSPPCISLQGLACQFHFWECGQSGPKLMPTSQTSRWNTKGLLRKSPTDDWNPGSQNTALSLLLRQGQHPSALLGQPCWGSSTEYRPWFHGISVISSSFLAPFSASFSLHVIPHGRGPCSYSDCPHLTRQPSSLLWILLWDGAACCCWQRRYTSSWPVLGTHLEYSALRVKSGVLLPHSPHILSHLATPRDPALFHLHYTLGYRALEPERWRSG